MVVVGRRVEGAKPSRARGGLGKDHERRPVAVRDWTSCCMAWRANVLYAILGLLAGLVGGFVVGPVFADTGAPISIGWSAGRRQLNGTARIPNKPNWCGIGRPIP